MSQANMFTFTAQTHVPPAQVRRLRREKRDNVAVSQIVAHNAENLTQLIEDVELLKQQVHQRVVDAEAAVAVAEGKVAELEQTLIKANREKNITAVENARLQQQLSTYEQMEQQLAELTIENLRLKFESLEFKDNIKEKQAGRVFGNDPHHAKVENMSTRPVGSSSVAIDNKPLPALIDSGGEELHKGQVLESHILYTLGYIKAEEFELQHGMHPDSFLVRSSKMFGIIGTHSDLVGGYYNAHVSQFARYHKLYIKSCLEIYSGLIVTPGAAVKLDYDPSLETFLDYMMLACGESV